MALAAQAVAAQVPPLRLQFLRIALTMLAALGWVISMDLLRVTGGASPSLPVLSQFCGEEAGQTNDCRSILTSRYSGIGSGSGRVPWAALGAGYFAVLLLWFLLVGIPARRQLYWHWLVLGLGFIGVAVSIHLLKTLIDLDRYCIGCIAIHVINGLLLALMIAVFFMRLPDAAPGAYPRMSHAVAALLAGVLALLLHVQVVGRLAALVQLNTLSRRFEALISDPEFASWDYARQPVAPLTIQENDLVSGANDSANTVVVYSDLQCERCKAVHELLEAIVRQHSGVLRVVYRLYPLDWTCNDPKLVGNLHPDACQAARAVIAVHQQNGTAAALRMLDTLYSNQEELSRQNYAGWAQSAGIESRDLLPAMDSDKVREKLQQDLRSGQELKLSSAPAVFLNGRRLTYWHSLATWEQLLGVSLSRPASARPAVEDAGD